MPDNKYYSQQRTEVLSFVPKTSKNILDVGCGFGVFAKSLKTPERNIWGTDILNDVEQQASKNCDTFILGDFTKSYHLFPKNYFDCIICNDVLEHILDPADVLRHCKSLLTEKGIIICSIPNFIYYLNLKQVILKKDFKYAESGILDRTHLRFFTKKSINRLFKECNYKLIKQKGINPTKSPIAPILSILSFGYFSEILFTQFVSVIKKNTSR
ncbi:MAG: class I SAM-dependent methyltransferase [Chitinophagaceae bacterium]